MRVKKEVRSETVTITVTAAEKQEMFQMAADADRTVSGWVRSLVRDEMDRRNKKKK